MYGYDTADPDKKKTGFVSYKPELDGRYGLYDITNDSTKAKKFWAENYDDIKGFGTPQQWLDFISDEPGIKRWKFHLVWRRDKNKDCQN